MARNFGEKNVLHFKSGRKDRSRLFLVILVLFLFVAIAVAAVYMIFSAEFLKVRKISIDMVRGVSNEKLISGVETNIMGRSVLASLLGPDNILFWRISPKYLTFASVLPIVSEASRNVDIMDRQVSISIREREVFGTWCAMDECFVFDNRGVVFAKAPDSEGILVIRVDDLNARRPIIGIPIFYNSEWRDNFFNTLKIIKEHNVPILKITVKDFSLREWEVVSTLGFSFYFNLDFVPDNLSAVITNISDRIPFSSIFYLDFRVPNRVYYQ